MQIKGIDDLMYYGKSSKNLYVNEELLTEANITTATKINDYAFYNCKSLMSVTIGNGVTSIGRYAFVNCNKLVEVINKSSLTITKGSSGYGYIGYYALNVKTEGESDIVNKDGYLFYTYDNVNYLLGHVGNETSLTLPDNCNGGKYEIYKFAFYNCSSLTSVTIPNSVTSIGSSAFRGCSALTSITIGSGVTRIGDYSFSGCSSLMNVTIPNGITIIEYCLFYGCTSLKSVTIPNSVRSLGDGVFEGCTSLNAVYYDGTAWQWYHTVSKYAYGNPNLTSNKLYYYSETEPSLNSEGTAYDGNYWHYADDGITPVVWKKEN